MSDNHHTGHRGRLKTKALKHGLDSLADHEVLELLLFFGIPYKNTNDLGHTLLNKFGSFSGVINAGYDSLIQVDGIGPHTATLISLLPEFFKRYNADCLDISTSFSKKMLEEYVRNHFIGESKEHVELFLFNSKLQLIKHTTLQEGTLTSCTVSPEKIGELIFSSNAMYFVLAHNHPSGTSEPSQNDLLLTNEIHRLFLPFNRTLIEHYIVAEDRCVGIKEAALDFYDK